MTSMLKRLFQTPADDISAIERDFNNPAINVYDITESHAYKIKDILPVVESPVCEQVCVKLAQKLGVGFFTSQLLGLHVTDLKTKCSKWLCPQDSVTAEPGQEIFLRLRHIPTKPGCSRLKEWDKKGLEYLYFQISDDFLHENLDLKGGIAKPDGLGLVTISLLIKLRLVTEQTIGNSEDLSAFLKSTDVTSFVPKSFIKDNPIDKLTLKKSIKEHLSSLHKKYPADKHSSKDLMKSYLEHILDKDVLREHFYVESFEGGMVVSGSSTVEIGVQLDKGTNAPSIKLINKQLRSAYFTCEMKDLTSLEINKRTLELDGGTEQLVHNLQIGHTGGVPQNVYFSNESVVRSLVSCVESFCRLTVDYYSSLCPSLAPKWYNEMMQAKVHGPSSQEYFERILKVKFSCQPDRYILYKSLLEYEEYYVINFSLAKKVLKRCLGKIEHTKGGYKLQGDAAEPEKDLRTLLRKIVGTKNLEPSNSIRPQTEVCDTIYQLLLDKPVPRLTAEDEIEADDQRRLEQQPKVFFPTDVEVSQDSLLGNGHFTNVQRAVLMEDDQVVIKTLRLSEIPDRHKHLCSKSLQDAMVKQMKFNNPLRQMIFNNLALFVGFIGIGLDSPTQMILEDTGNKSLKDFLRFREPTDTLRPQQLNDAMLNIANALWFMEHEKLYHGNLNCTNIIIRRYDSDSHTLSVKLADPGMVTLYNQMPLDSDVNKKRVPWLSPKLFDDLSAFSINTEVYAFGTTVWEMFNSGWGPLDVGQQLNGWGHEKVLEFYRSGSHLGVPVYLEEDKSDSDRVKAMKRKTFEIIKQCWVLDESEMVLPERIIRDINQGVGNYGNEYHEYDVIYYADDLSSANNLSTSGATSGHASLIYQGQFRDVPDLSCLNSPGTDQTVPKTVDTEQTVPKVVDTEQTVPKMVNTKQTVLKTVEANQTVPKTVEQRTPVSRVISPTQIGMTGLNFARQPVPTGCPQMPTTRPLPVKKVDHLIGEGRLTVDHTCVLGRGHYGEVYKGELTPSSSSGRRGPFTVAVKRLKREMVDKYADDFRKEIDIMQELEHENIVKFHGIFRGVENIVMEYLAGGSLFHYVTDNKIIPQEMFIRISLDVAKVMMTYIRAWMSLKFGKIRSGTTELAALEHLKKIDVPLFLVSQLWLYLGNSQGMEYLWSKKVLHMDLACRNVLLTNTQQAKVSDFGLSKVLVGTDKDYYRRETAGKVIPVFWCAMEWLKQERFTTKCDVWSFGITMWEMCSHGKRPNICKDDVTFQKEGFARMKSGERLPKPENCRPELYQLMRDCWLENEDTRPEFSECVTRLKKMSPPQQSSPGQPAGSDATGPPGGNRCDRGDNPTGIDAAAASPGGDRVNRGDNPNRLQKTLSENSETNSESDHDDYHKMTAGGDADNNPVASTSFGHSVKEPQMACADIQTPSAGTDGSEKEQNSQNPELSEPNIQNTVKAVDSKARPPENNKFVYIDEKDITLTEECLGKGAFGKVLKGKMKKNNKDIEVAVKVFDSSEDLFKRFRREMQLLGNVSHPNIVQFKGMVKTGGRTEKYVMELMSSTLMEYLVDSGKHDRLHTKLGFLLDIAKGMSYLAEKSILHCDLTSVNILLAFDLTAKISDFGLSKRLDSDKTETGLDSTYKRSDARFKLFWSAPEVFQKEVYNRSSDVWSYGVVCLEVFLNGKPLKFHGKTSHYWGSKIAEYSEVIKRGERFPRPEECPDNVYELITQCWSDFPPKRPTFDNIVERMSNLKEAEHLQKA